MKELSFTNRQKIKVFLPFLKPHYKIIDIGCGSMWLTNYLRNLGYNCVGFDAAPPADIVGDIKSYKFEKESFDVVIALEVIEHVDCINEIKKMLKSGGLFIISTPVPLLDSLLKVGEFLSILQKRTSPHSNLIYIKNIPLKLIKKKILFGIVQCGIFRKV